MHQIVVDDIHAVQTRGQKKATDTSAEEIVSKPYARQVLDSTEIASPTSSGNASTLKGVNVAMPIETMVKHHPELCNSLQDFLSTADKLDIHTVNETISPYSECTYADIFVCKIKVRAIIDSGAPINIVSTKLVKRLGIAPDIAHHKEYGTAGPHSTMSEGAYSALPLQIGSLAVTAPAVVLPNANYDILIGTSFMRHFGVRADYRENTLEILGQSIPMYYERGEVSPESPKQPWVNLAYRNGIVPVRYWRRSRQIRALPTQQEERKGLPLRACRAMVIPAGHQVLVETGLDVQIPAGLYGEVYTPWNRSRLEPVAAPGIVLPEHGDLKVLVANLQSKPLMVKKHQVVAYLHLIPVDEVHSIHDFGTLEEFGLPSPTQECPAVHSVISRERLSGLDPDQQDQAIALFERYRHIFAEDDCDLGCAKDVLHKIDTGDHAPIRLRPIRRSRTADSAVREEIEKLTANGLLIPSKSPWASPVLIVKKKDGSNRVVIDYWKLNNITCKDSYPLPRIDDALDRLGGAKFFSAMDLISGYWQIKLPPEEQEKCAIITSDGLYQPTRMPQGLCNAPATFQRAMDDMLSDLKLSCVLVYLDDINVFSRTFNEHLEHLEEVFRRLAAANLKIKPRKCDFFKEQLDYLGFVVDTHGLRPQPAKIEAIEKMKVPTNKRDVQVFLGMIGYYRRFVDNFSRKGEALFHLLKDGVKFDWSPACQEAFDVLRLSLTKAPILRYPDFNREFIVQTDASLTAVGGVLSQIGEDGEEHPVAYCSRTLNVHERNYTVTERECLAVIYAYKQFRVYLHGVHFKVVTDHASLRWLQNLREPEGRLARWALKLQAYDFEITHRAGSKHQNADGLSRLPTVAVVSEVADQLFDKMLSGNYQDEPETVRRVLDKLMENTAVHKGQLLKTIDEGNRIIPRPSQRTDLIMCAHKAVGHGAYRKTLEQLKQNFYWESMPFDVQETILCCKECQSEKPFKKATTFHLTRPNFAWHTVSIDVVGPLPLSNLRSKYIIVAIDHLTKWVEARAIRDVSALTTAKFILESIILRHGCPQFILSDNGTNFTSHVIPKLNELMGVRGVLSTPYHPETNGAVERVNGTLVLILRKLAHNRPAEWNTFLPSAMFAYNIAFHSSTGKSPFLLMYGRQPAIPPVLYSCISQGEPQSPNTYLERLIKTLIGLQSQAYSSSLQKKVKAHAAAEKNRCPLPTFQVGDTVLFHDTHGQGRSHKLDSLWKGPFEIIEKTSTDAYTIKELQDGRIVNRVHAKFLRAFHK